MAHEINQPIEPSAGLLRAKWLEDICDESDKLCASLGIEGDDMTAVKDFAIKIAKDQYLDGTRAGLRFRKSQVHGLVACNTEGCGLFKEEGGECTRCGNY